METFKSDCECDFFAFELITALTTRSSAIFIINRRTATNFDPTTILQTPIKTDLVVPKVVLVVEVVVVQCQSEGSLLLQQKQQIHSSCGINPEPLMAS